MKQLLGLLLCVAAFAGDLPEGAVRRLGRKPGLFVKQDPAGGVHAVAISPDGKLAATGHNRVLRLWDLETGKPIRELPGPQTVHAIRFLRDAKHVAWAGFANVATVATLEGRIAWALPAENPAVGFFLAATADEKTFLTAGAADHELLVVENGTGRVQSRLRAGRKLWTAAMSADGRYVVAGDFHDAAWLWDRAANAPTRELPGHESAVFAVAMDTAGKRCATAAGHPDRTVRLWNTKDGKLQHALAVRGVVRSLAFSPDGKTLATADGDGALILWDTKTGKRQHSFQGPTDGLSSIAFTPDGKRLLTGCFDGTALLWQPPNGAR